MSNDGFSYFNDNPELGWQTAGQYNFEFNYEMQSILVFPEAK